MLNINPLQIFRIGDKVRPIFELMFGEKPVSAEATFRTIVFDEKSKRYVVIFKTAFKKKKDAEKMVELDKLLDETLADLKK